MPVSNDGFLVTLEPLRRLLAIRRWKRADIDYVLESVSREGWGHTQPDVERCWKLEPNGCFIAEFQNKPVGNVFSICYERVGWIGLLIVNPECRGRGVGFVLMKTAVSYLQSAGAETIRLEAVEKAVPLYRRVGFIDEFDSLRFRKRLRQVEKLRLNIGTIAQMRDNDVTNVARFDAPNFGANRLSVLQSVFRDNPHLCFVAKEKGRITGYVMARQTQNGFWIGPWVCLNPETARHLLNALVATIEENDFELRVGLPVLNTSGLGLMNKLCFQLVDKSIHMVFGNQGNKGAVTHVYGIGGPEKG